MQSRAINSVFSVNGNGRTLTGYAAIFNSPAQIYESRRGVFTEIVLPGAFRNALASGTDIIATYNHSDRLLGRTSSNTLRLSEDDKGLRMEIDLPESANDIKELVMRGDLQGASITFAPRKGGEKWEGNTCKLSDLYLAELGPVINPAQPSTSLAMRSAHDVLRMKIDLALKKIP